MEVTNISSQDFRNTYEKFYSAVREYLWDYNTLKALAEVEVDIYSAFIEVGELEHDLEKLHPFIKDVMKEDKELQSCYDELLELIEILKDPEARAYHRLQRVSEVNPDTDKVMRTLPENEEEEETA